MTKLKKGSKFKKNVLLLTNGVLICLLLTTGFFLYKAESSRVAEDTKAKAVFIKSLVENDLKDIDYDVTLLEGQLNHRLKATSSLIANSLGSKPINTITNDDLLNLAKEHDLEAITLYTLERGNDIVGQKSTEPNNISLSLEDSLGKTDPNFLAIRSLITGQKVESASLLDGANVLFEAEYSSKTKEFFKQAYHKTADKNYLIGITLRASELANLESDKGLNARFASILEGDQSLKELAILDPEVYKDSKAKPSSQEGVLYGSFKLSDSIDTEALKMIARNGESLAYITPKEDFKVYKAFIYLNGQVLYVAVDYSLMSASTSSLLTYFSITSILILSGVTLLLSRLLGKHYRDIEILDTQIKVIASGDLTFMGVLEGKDDLLDLSNSINLMVNKLNANLTGLTKHLTYVQSLSHNASVASTHLFEQLHDSIDALESNVEGVAKGLEEPENSKTIEQLNEYKEKVEQLETQLLTLSGGINDIIDDMYKFKLS